MQAARGPRCRGMGRDSPAAAADVDMEETVWAHPLLGACKGDELLQAVLQDLSMQHRQWALLLPVPEAWEAEKRESPPSIDALRECVLILEGDFAFRTLEGQRGSFTEDLAALTFDAPTGDAAAAGGSPSRCGVHRRRVVGQRTVGVRCGDAEVALNCFFVSAPLPAASENPPPAPQKHGDPAPASGAADLPQLRPRDFVEVFVDKMRKHEAQPIVQSIKSFIQEQVGKADAARKDPAQFTAFHAALPAKVDAFLRDIYGELVANVLWLGCGESELAAAREGVEKYLLCKLHPYVFAACPQQVAEDAELTAKIEQLAARSPEELGVPEALRGAASHEQWESALRELRAMNSFKSPYDKIICISNCIRILHFITGATASPDEFLPCLVYLVACARPERLHCNLCYIASFRRRDKIEATEDGFYFSALKTAADRIRSAGVPAAGTHAAGSPRSPGAELADFLSTPAVSPPPAAVLDGTATGAAAHEAVLGELVRALALAEAPPQAPLPPPDPGAGTPRLPNIPVTALPALVDHCKRLWAMEDALNKALCTP
eukprot:TRINITY_DN25521_c0_g1_i1.p1 TRINITY_DN25521_c0_g1~~TRINITY_DN25521_c0_g1_i1.p1  ORF type:complete len:549 (+),score=156.72 TRINITY_DN25521_c0_g1_i1:38-1684(+)